MYASELYKLHQEWIESSLLSDRITEWENTFLESLKSQLEKKGSISSKQIEILERIYSEKT